MKEAKFTKGPWTITESSWADYSWDINMGSHNAAATVVVRMEYDADNSFELEANAYLIHAAPEMLQALLSIENDDGTIPESIWELRNNAIAKALGEL